MPWSKPAQTADVELGRSGSGANIEIMQRGQSSASSERASRWQSPPPSGEAGQQRQSRLSLVGASAESANQLVNRLSQFVGNLDYNEAQLKRWQLSNMVDVRDGTPLPPSKSLSWREKMHLRVESIPWQLLIIAAAITDITSVIIRAANDVDHRGSNALEGTVVSVYCVDIIARVFVRPARANSQSPGRARPASWPGDHMSSPLAAGVPSRLLPAGLELGGHAGHALLAHPLRHRGGGGDGGEPRLLRHLGRARRPRHPRADGGAALGAR